MIIPADNKFGQMMRDIGTVLFGPQWITPLALMLKIERESFKRMLSARRPPADPAAILKEARTLAVQKQYAIAEVIERPEWRGC